MAKQTSNNIKLGVFVIAGLILLVIGLYIIGKNHSLFGSKFELKARFANASGLMPGNNVRFSGIQAGTVRAVEIINDTTIEVDFYIEKKTRPYIRKNAVVSIGTEGMMGNKVLNIYPGTADAPIAEEGDILVTRLEADVTDVLETLYRTNDNVHEISEELLGTLKRINNSHVLWTLLNDTTLPENLRVSLVNIRSASGSIVNASTALDDVVKSIQSGEGVAGLLLKDTSAQNNLSEAISNIRTASSEANTLVSRLDKIILDVQENMDSSAAGLVLKDPATAASINRSLENIEKGTESFSESMEALKHNFLLRRYFRKKEQNK